MARPALRQLGVALIAATLAAVTLASPATATGSTTGHRADAAAGWLARQMVDGEHYEVEFGGQVFPDQGLTIDAVDATGMAVQAQLAAGRFGDARLPAPRRRRFGVR